MNVSMPTLIRKAARKAGLIAKRGHGPDPTPAEELPTDPMIEALDRQIEKHMQEMDEAMQRAEDEFMEPYRRFEREKYGGDPPSLLGEDQQLALDMDFDPDQRDLFAGVEI